MSGFIANWCVIYTFKTNKNIRITYTTDTLRFSSIEACERRSQIEMEQFVAYLLKHDVTVVDFYIVSIRSVDM